MDVVAVVGPVAALGGVALGQVLARSGEYRKWMRMERHKAASELLAAAEAARRGVYARSGSSSDVFETAREEAMKEASRVFSALESVRLVFPDGVVKIAQQYSDIIGAFLQAQHDNPSALVGPPDAYYETRTQLTKAAGRLIN